MAWPLMIVLVLLAMVSGFVLTRLWQRVMCFSIAFGLATFVELGLWTVAHFQFGD